MASNKKSSSLSLNRKKANASISQQDGDTDSETSLIKLLTEKPGRTRKATRRLTTEEMEIEDKKFDYFMKLRLHTGTDKV